LTNFRESGGSHLDDQQIYIRGACNDGSSESIEPNKKTASDVFIWRKFLSAVSLAILSSASRVIRMSVSY